MKRNRSLLNAPPSMGMPRSSNFHVEFILVSGLHHFKYNHFLKHDFEKNLCGKKSLKNTLGKTSLWQLSAVIELVQASVEGGS